ncbi:MAG: ATP-dependent Clp protease ATP-binding subunit [Actinobacteria bacterium]|nr:ATP-dependent Clp protease ATP-binding subunit [Actinomycetota bacterium]
MFNDLGESAKLAISQAANISEELNHSYLGTEHLFLGVIELEDYNIKHQLNTVGVDVNVVVKEVRKEIGTNGKKDRGRITLTPRSENVLKRAALEGCDLVPGKVEAPGIMIAILQEGKGVPARVLKNNGVDVDKLINQLRTMISNGRWTADSYETTAEVGQLGMGISSELMEDVGVDLTELAVQGKLDPVIGRELETLKLIQILLSRKKCNPILVGEAGVGKTAIIEGLAQLIASGSAPRELQGRRIRTIEVGALVAGTMYRGTFEQKLVDIIKEAKEKTEELIIFIDEIHMLVGAGRASGFDIDAANILKPALARGDFKCIGATTMAESKKYIEKDAALARRFQMIYIDETSKEETLEILLGLRRRFEDFHNVKILDETLKTVVDLSSRKMPNRHLPDKAIDLMDQVCSFRRLSTHYGHDQIDSVSASDEDGNFNWKVENPEPTITLISPMDVERVVSRWNDSAVNKPGKSGKKKGKKYFFMRV